jgi:hypothetical protein
MAAAAPDSFTWEVTGNAGQFIRLRSALRPYGSNVKDDFTIR